MDCSLRICLVSKQFPPGVGGAETYAYELTNGLADRGHDIDVYTQWIDSPDEEVDIHENVSINRICKARRKIVTFETLWFSFTARREIDFDEYDIVHGTMMPASTVAVTPFNDITTPVVLTSHGTSIGEMKAVALETPADYLLKFFFHPMNVVMDYVAEQNADKIIAISDHAEEQLIAQYGFDDDDVYMIPHGVNADRFYPREETHPAVNPEKKTVLYVGRLGARKGVDLALQAVAKLDNPEVEFLIAGTGRHEEYLRSLAAELKIENQIRFLGYVPSEDLPQLYSSSDVFVLPSKYEGFGLVVLEAAACGTPVIGANAGGIPTAIKLSDYGSVVERTAKEFSQALKSYNAGLHTKEDRSSGVKSHSQPEWSDMCEYTENVYWRIIAET